jgi:hypothetical protein
MERDGAPDYGPDFAEFGAGGLDGGGAAPPGPDAEDDFSDGDGADDGRRGRRRAFQRRRCVAVPPMAPRAGAGRRARSPTAAHATPRVPEPRSADEVDRAFVCPYCQRGYGTLSALSLHLRCVRAIRAPWPGSALHPLGLSRAHVAG